MEFDDVIISNCIKKDPKAQCRFFKKYSHLMFGVCLRYAKSYVDAQDILQEGFIKIFAKLHSFRNEGSLENWMRRIMINTSYNYYKRKYPYFSEIDFEQHDSNSYKSPNPVDIISESDILRLVKDLPSGYKKVFNLSAIEGYTHKEIGDMLNISKGTSKSQLNRARTTLKSWLTDPLPVEEKMEEQAVLEN